MINRELEIKNIAYRIWVDDGCKDGDELIDWIGGKIPRNEFQWKMAEVEYVYGPDYLRLW